jgi:hypothetical protein
MARWCADRLTALLTATLTAMLTDEIAERSFGSTITEGRLCAPGRSQNHSQQHSQEHSQAQVTALCEWKGSVGASHRASVVPVVVDGPAHGHDRVWCAMGENPC